MAAPSASTPKPVEATPLLSPLLFVGRLSPSRGKPLSPSESLSPIKRAAWLIEDALRGVPVDPTLSEAGFRQVPIVLYERYLAYTRLRAYLYPVLVALVVLAFFEVPLWCAGDGYRDNPWTDAASSCRVPGDSQFYISGLPYMPLGYSLILEAGLYVYLLMLFYRQYVFRNTNGTYLRTPLNVVYVLLSAAALLDTIVYGAAGFAPSFRVAPYARIALVALTEPVLTTLTSTAAAVAQYLRVLLIIIAFALLYAFVMATLLHGDSSQMPECRNESLLPGEASECPTADTYFEDPTEAAYTMVLLAACQQFPGKLLPLYANYRHFGLLWMVYFFLSNFILLNVTLATVFNAYQEQFQASTVERFKNCELGLLAAFKVRSPGAPARSLPAPPPLPARPRSVRAVRGRRARGRRARRTGPDVRRTVRARATHRSSSALVLARTRTRRASRGRPPPPPSPPPPSSASRGPCSAGSPSSSTRRASWRSCPTSTSSTSSTRSTTTATACSRSTSSPSSPRRCTVRARAQRTAVTRARQLSPHGRPGRNARRFPRSACCRSGRCRPRSPCPDSRLLTPHPRPRARPPPRSLVLAHAHAVVLRARLPLAVGVPAARQRQGVVRERALVRPRRPDEPADGAQRDRDRVRVAHDGLRPVGGEPRDGARLRVP